VPTRKEDEEEGEEMNKTEKRCNIGEDEHGGDGELNKISRRIEDKKMKGRRRN
jgi:hypothetical protein